MAGHTAQALSGTRHAEIIGDLNGVLAHLVDLSTSAKQAHWNVHGPNFQGLHELFDTITTEARQYSDDAAERVMAMGGTAHGTLQDASKGTTFESFPTDEHNWEPLVRTMHNRMVKLSGKLRELIASTEDDMATQDLYIEVQRGIDKRAWMLEAHLH